MKKKTMFCEVPDFGRCCFCLPLRRGVLLFGYINVLFSAFMVGVYAYCVNGCESNNFQLIYRGVTTDSVAGVCIAVYCAEIIVNCLLVYGAHEKIIICLKIFYYYSISTTLAAVVLEVVEFANAAHLGRVLEMGILTFTGLCIQLYLICLVRSLLNKLVTAGPHSYDNQLHTIVSGETKIDNGIYNNSTVVPNV
ncbi:uncharacterized protein LOC126373212 [Pectinophora gossypiella]|uniref:uncharacterized protein LOC126373212 n=1 Tax=Pectinophora gossypiella TaxID=13191 RepID=UPI00214F4853|nr:uncharacterized protein LOC126373212 [Pectinophora gossypiella]